MQLCLVHLVLDTLLLQFLLEHCLLLLALLCGSISILLKDGVVLSQFVSASEEQEKCYDTRNLESSKDSS
jgi:hypothetical protein